MALNPFNYFRGKVDNFKEKQKRLYELRILEKEDIVLYSELGAVVSNLFNSGEYHPTLEEYNYRISVLERVVKFREEKGWDVKEDIEVVNTLKVLRERYLERLREVEKEEI